MTKPDSGPSEGRSVDRCRRRRAGLGLLAALLLSGCAQVPAAAPPPSAPATATTSPATTPVSAPEASPAPPSATAVRDQPGESAQPLVGRTIVVDPGHNGKYSRTFNTKKVPAGNGKKKACNSSGTAGKGLAEHAYTWAQAKLLKAELERLGATVLLTRKNDSGLGPCVNQRAKVANDAGADLLISLHADGSHARKARGFHVIISTAMAGGKELEKRSKTLAGHAREALEKHTGMPRSTYIGRGTALSPRRDIATLNLLRTTPGIMMELGNMRHSADLKLLRSKEFRNQVATALAEAAVKTLNPG